MSDLRVPEGAMLLDVEVWLHAGHLILTGDPPDEEQDGALDLHHCDAMGCGLDHVLARIPIDPAATAPLAHLAIDVHGRALQLRARARYKSSPFPGPGRDS